MKDKDDFWSLDRILPKKDIHYGNPREVKAVNVNIKSVNGASDVDIQALFSAINENKSINSVEEAIVKESDYSYFENSNVMLYAYVGSYNNLMSYENGFRKSALALFDRRPVGVCHFAEYFSFKPSFEELSESQLEFYVYWRDNIRKGIYEKTSNSYVFLLISEIVNLPDKIAPADGIELMTRLWNECVDVTANEKLIADTIFEYCIVHNLPIPFDKLEPSLLRFKQPVSNMLAVLYVFDYLMVAKNKFSNSDLDYIFKKILGYSYDSGKHYNSNPELKKLLDLHFYDILGNFFEENPSYLTDILYKHKKRTSGLKVIKPAFLYVNTSSEIKRNIVYEYYPFEKNDIELEGMVNIAKYIENKLRSECGIRARLAVAPILPEIRVIVDKIVASVLHTRNSIMVSSERKKSSKKVKVDIMHAQNIEESSWQTTKMLTDGIDVFLDEEESEKSIEDAYAVCDSPLEDFDVEILKLILSGATDKARGACESRGMFLDSVLATLNEKFLDIFGDTIIDLRAYEIYDDYSDDVATYLTRSKNESK